ncbi:sortase domain-containing protein [Ilumatobacter nonamiensis]|uniref:sortase domain-containing protein n=1 Tax=Ilumatobacter nonamiensis TaxID=467093 RepID=UPI00034D693A|nr:sortase [Ilumatobacter nonamiensis]
MTPARRRPAALAIAAFALVSSCAGAEARDADASAGVSAPVVVVEPSASTTTTTTADDDGVAPTATATTPPTTAAPVPITSTPTTSPPTTTPQAVERSGADVGPENAVGDPIGIRIPSLEVDSPIVPTGVNPDGTVAVPPSADVAGWFEPGPRPGEPGPSVVMAHVDSARTGPGVFYRLREIQPGAVVSIDTADGSVDFVVDRTEQHAKVEFPTNDVYGAVPGRQLRLVTCGGEFDRSARSYYDNIIVYLNRIES